MHSENAVLGEVEVKQQPAAVTVLGNVGDAPFAAMPCVQPADLGAADLNTSRKMDGMENSGRALQSVLSP